MGCSGTGGIVDGAIDPAAPVDAALPFGEAGPFGVATPPARARAGDRADATDAPPSSGDAALARRVAAATFTANHATDCVRVRPFYWEVGDVSGALASGSVNDLSGVTYTATTVLAIASASKWLYATYWVERTGGALSASDVDFFTLHSGYTRFTSCAGAPTVGACLDIGKNGDFVSSTYQKFFYGGGHMQNHAAQNGLAALDNAGLAAEMQTKLGTDVALSYNEPQLAGGAVTSAAEYAKVLRKILAGQLKMNAALGTHAVCADPTTCPDALVSPAPANEQLHYSIGHWVEDDPNVGDGAFSSAGAFGFYPWIDATKTLYGVLSRKAKPGSGFDSLACGRLVRKAWVTGVAQMK